MRRLGTALALIVAMLAAAGVGAYIAAHTTARDQPGIENGPGSGGPHRSGPSTDPMSDERWHGVMVSRTTRSYRSGGTCSTDWRLQLRLDIGSNDAFSGAATAKLTSGPDCSFVTGQPQINTFDVRIAGTRTQRDLQIRLTARPSGTGTDYGGFGEVFSGSPRTITVPIDMSNEDPCCAAKRSVFRAEGADAALVSLSRNSVRLTLSG